jgi:hypothetical protein
MLSHEHKPKKDHFILFKLVQQFFDIVPWRIISNTAPIGWFLLLLFHSRNIVPDLKVMFCSSSACPLFINFYAAAANNEEENYGTDRRSFAVSSVLFSQFYPL